MRGIHQEMQVLEIIVVPRQENQPLADGVEKMAWICRTAQRCVGWNNHLLARLCKSGNQGTLRAVVIAV